MLLLILTLNFPRLDKCPRCFDNCGHSTSTWVRWVLSEDIPPIFLKFYLLGNALTPFISCLRSSSLHNSPPKPHLSFLPQEREVLPIEGGWSWHAFSMFSRESIPSTDWGTLPMLQVACYPPLSTVRSQSYDPYSSTKEAGKLPLLFCPLYKERYGDTDSVFHL